ncbi:MAG: hypothetical protein KDK39_17010 [Leptospiraceae bacterium]|nr:hypothetical protein [Leptospiraceae bacterium]
MNGPAVQAETIKPYSLYAQPILYKGLSFKLLTGRHYALYCRCSQDEARTLLRQLDAFYEREYAQFFVNPVADKTRIVLFQDELEYRRSVNAPDGQWAHYDPALKISLSYYQKNPGALFHESVHRWLDANYHSGAALWFNEGFASYFESPMLKADGSWQYQKVNFRIQSLAQQDWRPLTDLMRRIDLRYPTDKAQARALFAYLADRGLLRDYVRQYLETCFGDPDGIAALELVLHAPLGQIDLDLQEWVHKHGAPATGETSKSIDQRGSVALRELFQF